MSLQRTKLTVVLFALARGGGHVAPAVTNVAFDGPGANEDFGLEQVTGSPADRHAFRTSPLRNVSVQPTFFHNGAFTRLEEAPRFHLNPAAGLATYDPAPAGLDLDLQGPQGPSAPLLERLDPLMQTPAALGVAEFRQLLAFLTNGLLDPKARPENLRKLVPARLPGGRPVHVFQP